MWVHGHAMVRNIVGVRHTLIMQRTLRNVWNWVVAVAAGSVRRLWVLRPVLLHVLNAFQLRGVPTLVLLRTERFQLAWAHVAFGRLLQILVWFERAFPSVILRHQVLLKNISVVGVFRKTYKVVEIGLESLLPLFFRNFLRIYFLELRESLDDERSVQLFLRTRVVREPEHFEVLKALQMVNFI